MSEIKDKSSESIRKHIVYYKSLSKITRYSKRDEGRKSASRINHLKERINAVNLNKERIERRFQDNLKGFNYE